MELLVVQLFPRQYQWLMDRYTGPHKVDYVDSSEATNIRMLRNKIKRADKVVLLTKFISHSIFENVDRDKVIYCDSVNVENMLETLNKIPADPVKYKPASEKPAEVVAPRIHTVHRTPPMSTSTTRTVGGFVLTTAVPPPSVSSISKAHYPFAEMHVGESFFVECPEKEKGKVAARIASAFGYFRRQHPEHHLRVYKTSTREQGGVRCWRMPDKKKSAK